MRKGSDKSPNTGGRVVRMKKIVFVVDDMETNLAQAKETLDSHYTVITMSSAQKMFAILEKRKPDLILLDILMPQTSGFEAMEALQKDKRYSDIPVVFLTSERDPDVESKCFELGAADFITKPFTQEGLLKRVRTQINMKDLIEDRDRDRGGPRLI